MNEFPRDFPPIWHELSRQSANAGFTGTEYIELVEAAGVGQGDYPTCQAVGQHLIWSMVDNTGLDVDTAIKQLKATDPSFNMEGGSWTNERSWVDGYREVMEPMERLSVEFHSVFDEMVAVDPGLTSSSWYRAALLYNLVGQTSCYRYWGHGRWTEYAKSIYNKGQDIVRKGVVQQVDSDKSEALPMQAFGY